MKTKTEILNETAAFYNLNNRSVRESESVHVIKFCMYTNPDGKHCAFARCCQPDKISLLKEENTVEQLIDNCYITYVDSVLLPEYHGHSVDFWRGVQGLHDNEGNWNETGLSQKGKDQLDFLVDYWQNQEAE
jgi:hypothetical protein